MKNINQSFALRYGLIAGLGWSAITFAVWAAGIDALVSFSMIGAFVPVIIGLFVYGGFELRKARGGSLPFKEALQFAFLAYVIYEVCNALTTYVLYNVIDPTLTTQMLQKSLEKMQGLLENSGVASGEMDKAMEKAMEEEPKTSPKQIIFGLGFALIWSFVKSLIIAAIVKKEPQPVFDELS